MVFTGLTHCGAAGTPGGFVGEWGIFFSAVSLGGLAIWPEYIAGFLLAYALGIVFQYFAIAQVRRLGIGAGILAAIKAATLSLIAFEIGVSGGMALSSFVFLDHRLQPDNPVSWFMMQIGMVAGFATRYAMNWWPIVKGSKEAM